MAFQNSATPLHVAAEGGHYETCEVLAGKGAKVNAQDEVRSKFSLPYTVGGLWLCSCIILA